MAQTTEGAAKLAARATGLDVDEFLRRESDGLFHCPKCREWKPRSEFGADRSRRNGLKKGCLICYRVKVRKTTKGRVSAFKGRTHTYSAKLAMSQAKRGMKLRLGIRHTEESRKKMSNSHRAIARRGPDSPQWKGGASDPNRAARRAPEYRDWKRAVFERDKYKCQKCGDARGGNLCAHHIKPFATHPELRYEVENGLTFCHTCHELEHFKPDSIRNRRKLKRGERLWV